MSARGEKIGCLFAFMSLRSPVLFPFNDPFICSGWSCSRMEDKMADINVDCYLMLMAFPTSLSLSRVVIIWTLRNKSAVNMRNAFTNLHSGLGQVDFKCYLLAHKNIGISSLAEQRLEDVELGSGEGRPLASLLSRIHTWKCVGIWMRNKFGLSQ